MAQTALHTVAVKEITRGRSTIRVPTSRLSLSLIVLFQGLISLLTLHNTAFQDEALYLLAGRQIFNGWVGLPHVSVPWGYYFSGYPYVYPVIGGVLDMLGGVALARMFSLLCMMGLTLCVYYVTKHLFDQNSAILAAALFASQGTVLFLGRLATYDALCLLFLGLATVLAVHVSIAHRPWAILGIGPLLIVAFLAKYAALLFVPIPFALLFCSSIERQGRKKMFVRIGLALSSLIVTSVVTYLKFDEEALHGLINTTTNRDSIIVVKTPALVLAHDVIILGGVGLALGLLGLLLVSWRRLPIGLVLFGASLLAPAYSNLTYVMQTQVRLDVGRYLAEDFDVCRYYMRDTTDLWQWNSLDFFDYTDKQGHYLVGKPAYHAAIQAGYFDLIELSFGYNPNFAGFIYQELLASKKYDLIEKIPYQDFFGSGYFWIWRKR